jgi:hypothetical protein
MFPLDGDLCEFCQQVPIVKFITDRIITRCPPPPHSDTVLDRQEPVCDRRSRPEPFMSLRSYMTLSELVDRPAR